MIRKAAAAVIAIMALAACQEKSAKKIDQKEVCIFNAQIGVDHCREGQLSFFMPYSWGSEQLPLRIVSQVCDFEHPIVYNNGGVVCVHTKQRLKREDAEPQKNGDSSAPKK